jgi:ChrR Cupin-like domain
MSSPIAAALPSEHLPMAIDKGHREFHQVDMTAGDWHRPEGYPEGIEQKVLAGALDEANKRGNRTRLLRFKPGAFTTRPFVHDYWEEVYVVSGDLLVGSDANVEGGKKFVANSYACRPPGVQHGPFRSKEGCVLLEFHYFEPSESGMS